MYNCRNESGSILSLLNMGEETIEKPFSNSRYRPTPHARPAAAAGSFSAFDLEERRNVEVVEVLSQERDHESGKSLHLDFITAADRLDQLTDLDHASLIKTYDYFTDDGRTFLALEPVDARNFAELFSRERTPALSNILQWSDDLFDVLIYLHSRPERLLHNDITPQNVWLTMSSKIKLAHPSTYSSAKRDLDVGSEKDGSALPYRSLEYLWADIDATTKFVISRGFDDSPFDELLKSEPDERSDIYSLSATLYFAMTKMPPVDAMTRTVSILDGSGDPLRSVFEIDRSIPESISNVIMKGLSVKRAERYHSAYDMRMDLVSASAELFDGLTRLPNADQFKTHLISAIEETLNGVAPKFAVMLVEIADNDIYSRLGRLSGDEAILKFSQRIRSSVRMNDIVGRLGPNRFALLLFEAGTAADISNIAGRILTRLAEPLKIDDESIQITSNVGTSAAGKIETSTEEHLQNASAALESARATGPNSSAIF